VCWYSEHCNKRFLLHQGGDLHLRDRGKSLLDFVLDLRSRCTDDQVAFIPSPDPLYLQARLSVV